MASDDLDDDDSIHAHNVISHFLNFSPISTPLPRK